MSGILINVFNIIRIYRHYIQIDLSFCFIMIIQINFCAFINTCTVIQLFTPMLNYSTYRIFLSRGPNSIRNWWHFVRLVLPICTKFGNFGSCALKIPHANKYVRLYLLSNWNQIWWRSDEWPFFLNK